MFHCASELNSYRRTAAFGIFLFRDVCWDQSSDASQLSDKGVATVAVTKRASVSIIIDSISVICFEDFVTGSTI